jgi:hypothetical protein
MAGNDYRRVSHCLVSLFMPSSETTKANLSLAEQQYSLGQFHLNKWANC